VANVSKNSKFVADLFTSSFDVADNSVCDNFLARIFKTAANAGNRYKHNDK